MYKYDKFSNCNSSYGILNIQHCLDTQFLALISGETQYPQSTHNSHRCIHLNGPLHKNGGKKEHTQQQKEERCKKKKKIDKKLFGMNNGPGQTTLITEANRKCAAVGRI